MASEITIQLPHHELYEALINCTNHCSPVINRLLELEECLDLKQKEGKWSWSSPIASEYGSIWLPFVHWASVLGKYVVLQWLKSKHVDMLVKCSRENGITNSTALHSVIWFVDHEELPKLSYTGVKKAENFGKVMDIIVDESPNILLETEEPSGDTILHLCCRKMVRDQKINPELLKVIFEKLENYKVSYKFDTESLLCKQNCDGETFLHLLCMSDSQSCAFAIKETWSKYTQLWRRLCSIKDFSGKTPYDIAAQNSALDSLDVFKTSNDVLCQEKNLPIIISKNKAEKDKNSSSNEMSSTEDDEIDKPLSQYNKRKSVQDRHTPFCEKNCKISHNEVLLSLNRCIDKSTTDQFIDVLKKYLGPYWGCVRKSKANANLEDPSYYFPIVHWACALGKHEALERISKMKAFNMAGKACTGETGLHRAVRCLYRGLGEPTKASKIKEVSQIFSKILDILTSSSREIFVEADDCGDTVLHASAKELYHCKEKFPSKFRFLEECMEKLLKKLASWKKSGTHADLAASVLFVTNDREQNFVHLLVRVPEFRSDSIVKLLKMVDVDSLRKLLNMQDCMDETPKETAERKNHVRVVKFINDLMFNTEGIASPSPNDEHASPSPNNEHIPLERSGKEPDAISVTGSQPDPVSLTEDTEYNSSCEKDNLDSSSEEDDERDTIAISAIPKAEQVSEVDDERDTIAIPARPKAEQVAEVDDERDTIAIPARPKAEQVAEVDDERYTIAISARPKSEQVAEVDIDDPSLQSPKMSVVDFVAQLSSSPNFSDTASTSGRTTNQDYNEEQVDSTEVMKNTQLELTEDDKNKQSPNESDATGTTSLVDLDGSPSVAIPSDYSVSQSLSNTWSSLNSKEKLIEDHSCNTGSCFSEDARGQPVSSSTPFNRNSRDTLTTPGSRLKRKLEMLINEAVEKDETYHMLEKKKNRLDDDMRREESKQQEIKKQQKELELEMERSIAKFNSLKKERQTLEIEIKNVNDWYEQHNKRFCGDQDI